jgi:two-component system, NarL family, sensor histidine kinase DesK
MVFLTLDSAALGLLAYGLTRLAQLAVQLEKLRGELARKAVAGERLRLDAELATARDVLASAGVDVRTHVSVDPAAEVAAILVPVVREAFTNILKHSSASFCVLEMTADATQLRLFISNDGGNAADGAPLAPADGSGNGLRNLAARIEAAGGRLIATREGGTFTMSVELPLV